MRKKVFSLKLLNTSLPKKLLLFIKLTLLLTILCLNVWGKVYSQERLSINLKNVTRVDVISLLERKTSYRFLYSKSISPLYERVTIKVKDASVEDIIKLLFDNSTVTYSITQERLVIISQKDIKSSPVFQLTDTLIRGRVVDENGSPIEGVSITVKGTKMGTITDANGYFSLNVPTGTVTLIFSSINFETKEILTTDKTFLNVSLISKNTSLGQVVIIGYGTTQKKDLTGSISSISSDDVKSQPVNSLNQVLQGRAAGVQVTQATHAPGGGINIRIRGGNSISASNEPLYVIDGFPVTSPASPPGYNSTGLNQNFLATINPNDIESIEILKDASATAIYGSRGANGVVLITTRRGKEGQSTVNFDFYTGFQQVIKKIDMVTAEEHLMAKNEQLQNLGFAIRYGNPNGNYPKPPSAYGRGTDWQDEIFRIAPISNYQLTFSGGTKKIRYLLSSNYFDQEGIVIKSNFRRYSVRINLDINLSDKLRIGNTFTTTRSLTSAIDEYGGNSLIGAMLNFSPANPIYDSNGNYQLLNVGPGSGFNPAIPNPVALANTSTNDLTSDRVLGTVFGEYNLLKGLTLKVLLGADIFNSKRYVFYTPQTTYYDAQVRNGFGSNAFSSNLNLLNENTLNYDAIISANHHINAVVGITFQHNREERSYQAAEDFPNYSLGANNLALANKPLPPSGGVAEWGLNSYLARINYSFKNKYLLTLAGRVDGSSRFGKNNKYGFFPSGAVAWRISEENFLKNSSFLSDAKLRISYGLTGNDAIGLYNSLSKYGTDRSVFNDQEVLINQAVRVGNPDLRWEKTKQVDMGIDVTLINRLQFTADYYIKTTTDLLLNVELPSTTGFNSVLKNIGSVENRGFEFSTNCTLIKNKNFRWELAGNISFNRNRVLNIGTAKDLFVSESIVRVGEPIGSFYGTVFTGIWKTQSEIDAAGPLAKPGSKPGAPKFADINGDGKFNESDDRTILGSGVPKTIYGFTNTFILKRFDISFFFQGQSGNKILNLVSRDIKTSSVFNGMSQDYYVKAWRASKPDNPYPALGQYNWNTTTSFLIEDGSYIRLRNMMIGYQVPIKAKLIQSARIYVSAQNLLTITKYSGYDPEVNSEGNNNVLYGYDRYGYPSAKCYTIGFNVSF